MPISRDRPRNARTSLGLSFMLAKMPRRRNESLTIGSDQLAGKKGAARELEAPVPRGRASGLQRADALEHLHPVVGGVGDVDEAGSLVDDDAVEVAELAVAGALLAPHREEVAVLVEHLDAIVADLGDIDVVVLV